MNIDEILRRIHGNPNVCLFHTKPAVASAYEYMLDINFPMCDYCIKPVPEDERVYLK